MLQILMKPKYILASLDVFGALLYSVLDIIALIVLWALLKAVLRIPRAQIHRRWAKPFAISAGLTLIYRFFANIHLLNGSHWPIWATFLLHLVNWVGAVIGTYGTVQLGKVFRMLLLRHSDDRLQDMSLEEWPQSPTVVPNSWDVSEKAVGP